MICLKTGACKILVSGGRCWIKDAVFFLLVLQQKILKNFLILIGIILEEALK